MSDLLSVLDTTDKIFLIIAILSGIMVLLQAVVNRAVWNGYLYPFLFSLGWLLCAVLL